jgi:hypothetical protein
MRSLLLPGPHSASGLRARFSLSFDRDDELVVGLPTLLDFDFLSGVDFPDGIRNTVNL